MYRVEVLKRATNSIISTVNYIAEDNIFYANLVQEYIYKSINLLKDFPYLWTEKWIYRVIVEPKYKFKIVYRIKDNTIFVVWVYREQKSWK